MTEQNKTSQAVEELTKTLINCKDGEVLFLDEGSTHKVRDFRAITAKYKRMEEALHVALIKAEVDGSDPGLIKRLQDAIDFDPLSP